MTVINKIKRFVSGEASSAPLAVFRIAFGAMMLFSLIRFVLNGWIETLYLKPGFFFTFYGFEWIKPLGATGMYAVFFGMMVCSVFIAAGFLYRLSAVVFFVLFTYVELIDKSNYLNHYYFISLISMLMIWLPANARFSVDNFIGLAKPSDTVPRWAIFTLQLQIALVYFFAGLAKINSDWLLQALPLKIWLPSKAEIPVIGSLLDEQVVAYLFSWCGMLFDVSIAFFLFYRRTVWYAYALVVIFHLLTAIVFPGIGVFPFVMIVSAAIFLPAGFHERLIAFASRNQQITAVAPMRTAGLGTTFILVILMVHFSIQFLLPLRHWLYPGKLFYTEEGYRFSWRVMLMEKAGVVFFHVKDRDTGKIVEIKNCDYLSPQQEKQMSTQPDMMLQYAHYLKEVYARECAHPEVYAEGYVTVNGRASRLFIDPEVNLAELKEGFAHKKWILAQGE